MFDEKGALFTNHATYDHKNYAIFLEVAIYEPRVPERKQTSVPASLSTIN